MHCNKRNAGNTNAREGESVRFNNYYKQLPVLFVIYADFEAIVGDISSAKNRKDKSFTEEFQSHKDHSDAYKVVCCYDSDYNKPIQLYRGENGAYKFLEKLLEEDKWCQEIIRKKFNKSLVITQEEEEEYNKTKDSKISGEAIYKPIANRVRDYC